MKNRTDKMPAAISDYITAHFKEDFLFDVKDIKELHGQTQYTVEVSKDNFIYQLKFDQDGKLINEQADQAFPADIHDEPGYDEILD